MTFLYNYDLQRLRVRHYCRKSRVVGAARHVFEFVTMNLIQSSSERVSAATVPFMVAMVGNLVLVVLFPWLSLYLPGLWGLYAG